MPVNEDASTKVTQWFRPLYLGIDPGLQGGIAMIDDKGNVELWDMPTVKWDGKSQINVQLLHAILFQMHNDTRICCVEEQRGYSGQSSATGFKQGIGYGQILATCVLAAIPHTTVIPHVWKKKMLAGYKDKRDKKNSIAEATNLFPKESEYFYGPKGGLKDGRAEALLLADYGRRLYSDG